MDTTLPDATRFTIGFDDRDRDRVHTMWDEIFDSQRWSEGQFVDQFETIWADLNGLPSRAFSGWAGGALAALNFFDVRGETVLCPSNTFMATVNTVHRAGGSVQFVDCNRHDLCVSYDDFVVKAEKYHPKVAWLVHIGGHIAFESDKIAAYCKDQGIWLLEDCAHAHGASWNGKKPGQWGDAGIYSFYATKTVSTGEGGMLVSANVDLITFAEKYRNWGKFEHEVEGLNFRMNEFTAALGVVQAGRLEDIIAWKNSYAKNVLEPQYPGRLQLPDGMTSGLYKYIVFDEIEKSTGKVYDQPCHRILGHDVDLPNSDWAGSNHWCVPLYYHGCGQSES